MALTKMAYIRYRALDKCLREGGIKDYTIHDLLREVNSALDLAYPGTPGIKLRQLRKDIAFMKSDEVFNAPIEYVREGQRHTYRYSKQGFSINTGDLSSVEAEKVAQALEVLSNLKSRPEFNWMQDTYYMLQERFGLSEDNRSILSYDANPDYMGLKWLDHLYSSIKKQQVIEINYAPFNKPKSEFQFHPQHLRQYNNRWFVFGYSTDADGKLSITNVALDRIEDIQDLPLKYHYEYKDWEEFFDEIIGVTNHPNDEETEVKLLFSESRAPYIITKPLHPSQKHKTLSNGKLEVRIQVKPNFELKSLILSFGKDVEVLEPPDIRAAITDELKTSCNVYSI